MIASIWPEKTPPAGADRFDISAMGHSDSSPTLGGALDSIGLHQLRLGTGLQAMLAADRLEDFKTVMGLRGTPNGGQPSEAWRVARGNFTPRRS